MDTNLFLFLRAEPTPAEFLCPATIGSLTCLRDRLVAPVWYPVRLTGVTPQKESIKLSHVTEADKLH
ncbi:hypothetical protein RUM43_011108, partial [Polyplax serrata]